MGPRSPRPTEAGDDISVNAIGSLMAVDVADLDNARRLLAIFGDAGRRTIVEQLSLRPETPGNSLPEIMGMDPANIYARLRNLRHNKVLHRYKDHFYRVEPEPLRFVSRYFDVLAVASSLKSPRHESFQ